MPDYIIASSFLWAQEMKGAYINMRINVVASLITLVVIVAGCSSQGPMNPDGTLPIVGGLVLLEDACRGDTLAFMWDPLTVEVDHYSLWYSDNPLVVWMKAGDFPGPGGFHVADRLTTYSVWAQRGTQHSSALSARLTPETTPLGVATAPAGDRIAGFSVTPDTIFGGDATNPDFHQDFFIRNDMLGYIILGGHTDPRTCPGGRWAQMAPAPGEGFKAPEPDDPQWSDTLMLLSSPRFFIRLENGNYGRFTAMVYQNPDTLQQGEIAEVNFVYQPIRRVRLFD